MKGKSRLFTKIEWISREIVAAKIAVFWVVWGDFLLRFSRDGFSGSGKVVFSNKIRW